MGPLMNQKEKRNLLMELLLEKHRCHYPALSKCNYFNYGAQGVMAKETLDKLGQQMALHLSKPPFSVDLGLDKLAVVKKARAAMAELLGVAPQRISLMENTSAGCNLALWGTTWQAGDRILISSSEYPSVVKTAQLVAKRFNLSLDCWSLAGDDATILTRLQSLITAKSRMLVLSHVTWDEGRLLPLEKISALCRQLNPRIKIVVDGAQSVGVIPLHLEACPVDVYAFTGHKWLCAPEGTGGLYIHPDTYPDLEPCFLGGMALDLADPTGNRLWPDARRFEGSTFPWPLYAGLVAALAQHERWGDGNKRFQRLHQLSNYFWQKMKALNCPELVPCQNHAPQVGLIYLTTPDPMALARGLERHNILIRTVPGTQRVRISVHYLTTHKELDLLADTMHALVTQKA